MRPGPQGERNGHRQRRADHFGDGLRRGGHVVYAQRDTITEGYVISYSPSENTPLQKGDEVTIMSIGKDAILLEDPDKSGNVQLQAGILKTRVNIKDLKLKDNSPQIISDGHKAKASTYSVQRNTMFKDEIDLRGMTGDEAWLAVDKYIDEANIIGIQRVRLIHGKGTGALKKALWQFLKGDKRIASFRIGQYGEGDGGVTIVDLK